MPPIPITDSFVFWTHKGGVGKTTLCLHSAITYAELNPKKAVIMLDLDEQANLSSTVCTELGNHFSTHERQGKNGLDAIKGLQKPVDPSGAYSRTLCGLLLAGDLKQYHLCKHTLSDGTRLLGENSFLVNPKAEGINDNMPENVHLLCGDRRIAGLAPHFVQKCARDDALKAQGMGAIEAEWKTTHLLLKRWLDEVRLNMPSDKYDGVTVFIDCNPSMNFFTELAMCTGKKLVVPVNADDFSLAAVESMFYSLYGMYQIGGNMADYEEKMFHAIAKRPATKVELPKVHAVIHNRSAIYGNKQVTCFEAMSTKQAEVLYKAYDDARHGREGLSAGSHKLLFNHDQLHDGPEPQKTEEFAAKFTGVMRDMGSTAVITVHSGIGMWLVKRNKKNIKHSLPEAKINNNAVSSLADLVGPARDMRTYGRLEAENGQNRGDDGDQLNKRNGRDLYLIELLQGSKASERTRTLGTRAHDLTTGCCLRSPRRCARTFGGSRRRMRRIADGATNAKRRENSGRSRRCRWCCRGWGVRRQRPCCARPGSLLP